MSAKEKTSVITVSVQPGASRSEIKALMADGSVRVRVAAPPVRGRANEELLRFLSRTLRIPSSSLWILRGERSRLKRVAIEGMGASEVIEVFTRELSSKAQRTPRTSQD